MTPDDALAIIRLARAAAGEGRTDEALRILRKVAAGEGRPGADDPRRFARLHAAVYLAGLHPIIPFIEGDGTGPDIWRGLGARLRRRGRQGLRRQAQDRVARGARRREGLQQDRQWLPDETLTAFRDYLVGIKGPLTTPVGGGIRSLNVALRQILDLYVCLRPVRWFTGVPSPVKRPS
jgi:isocitrate dehydrogenase